MLVKNGFIFIFPNFCGVKMFQNICGVSPPSIPGNAPMEAPNLGKTYRTYRSHQALIAAIPFIGENVIFAENSTSKTLVIWLVVEPTPLKNSMSQNWESFPQFLG